MAVKGNHSYDTKHLRSMTLGIIRKHKVITVLDICSLIPCTTHTFYRHKLHLDMNIIAALNRTKIKKKKAFYGIHD